MKQLQKVQNAVAGFVLNKYPKTNDVIHVELLPTDERIEYSLAIVGFKVIYDENVSNHLKLTQKVASTTIYEVTIKELSLMELNNRKLSEHKPGLYLTNYPQTFDQ